MKLFSRNWKLGHWEEKRVPTINGYYKYTTYAVLVDADTGRLIKRRVAGHQLTQTEKDLVAEGRGWL